MVSSPSDIAFDVVVASPRAPDARLSAREPPQLIRSGEQQAHLLTVAQLRGDAVLGQAFAQGRAEAIHDRPRCSGGREYAPPGARLGAGIAGLLHRLDIL